MDFDFRRNTKYFTDNGKLMIAGIVTAVIGGAFTIYFRWSMLFGTLFFIVFALGLVLIFASLSGRSNDKDIDNQTSSAIDGLYKYAVEKLNLDRIYNHALPEFVLSGYDYNDKDNRKFKSGHDSKIRTDRYGAFAFIFTPDKLYVFSRQFSLIENNIIEDSESFEYPSIAKVEMVDRTYKIMIGEKADKELVVKNEAFSMKLSDGGERTYCVHNTIDADNIAENIERYKRQTHAQQQ